jgi:hypothetical protein
MTTNAFRRLSCYLGLLLSITTAWASHGHLCSLSLNPSLHDLQAPPRVDRDTTLLAHKHTQLMIVREQLGEQVEQYTYWLIRDAEQDTSQLMTSRCRDWPAPNVYWVADDYLLYEKRDELNNKIQPQIHLRNLHTHQDEYSTRGLIPIKKKSSGHFYDEENQVLIFYRVEASRKVALMKFDIQSREVTQLSELGALDIDFPVVEMNHSNRELSIAYYDHSTDQMIDLTIPY